jgi:quercetin dioxygenase-like cupin family protein
VRAPIVIAAALVVAGTVAPSTSSGQPPAAPTFKRTVVLQSDLSTPGREVVQALVEFQPGGTPGRHTHAGEEVAYVIDGAISIEQADKPPVTVKAGQSFIIPGGQIHNAINTNPGVTRLLVTYIVEKGKPLATPAPPK